MPLNCPSGAPAKLKSARESWTAEFVRDRVSAMSLGLQVTYSRRNEPWQVTVNEDAVAELIQPFGARQRGFLVRLLNGYSKGMAASAVGVSVRATQLWAKKNRAFAEAVSECEQVGFATVIESELYRRALGGVEDRGSMRALELVLKSRSSDYRDGSTGTDRQSLVTAAAAEMAITDRWRESQSEATQR